LSGPAPARTGGVGRAARRPPNTLGSTAGRS